MKIIIEIENMNGRIEPIYHQETIKKPRFKFKPVFIHFFGSFNRSYLKISRETWSIKNI